MTDTFDSRALRRTDCYAQRFMKTGSYKYNVVAVGGHCITDERPFVVKVEERPKKKGDMVQHSIIVTFDDGAFHVDQKGLTVLSGDLVLWNCQSPKAVPFAVAGDKDFFASDRMTRECGYSHAFGSPGEFHWVDAYGSGLDGIVQVTDPGCKDKAGFARWKKLLTKGTVVMIDSARARPRVVQIVTGQTVFFSVVKAPGVSITDERILDTKPTRPVKPVGHSRAKKKAA